MRGAVLLDAGPLVALLDRGDRFHAWAKGQLARFDRALLTCEAVLAEATYLLRNLPGGGRAVLELIDRGVVEVPFRLEENVPSVSKLIVKYANLPMSLADGCLVRMAELHQDGVVMTLDHDFRIYRKNGRNIIPTIMPDEL